MSEPGKALKDGRYTLVRVLGEGGQGETFEAIDNGIPKSAATDAALAAKWERYVQTARDGKERAARAEALETVGRLVAVKRFRVGEAKAWKDVELAEREARTLASLDHAKLPKYIEHFEEAGALYLVMEKVEGESLAAIRKKQVLGHDDVVRMLEDIGDALRYIHGRAPFIVHRDIKPANIIRRPDGSFALVDFGAVRDRLKPAGGSTVVGTFGYMAPEQFQGRASPKSDVYGLGATAVAMLTGAEPEDLPHEGLGIDVARALPKNTPPGLVRALSSMLVPDPDRRIASVDAALTMLRPSPKDERNKGGKRQSQSENERQERRDRKRASRAERRARRDAARARHPPFLFRLVAKLGLLTAMLAVWLTMVIVVPLVLIILSLLFGAALRRAAHACIPAARRAQSKLNEAWRRISGEVAGDERAPAAAQEGEARVRLALEDPEAAGSGPVVTRPPARVHIEEAEFDDEFDPQEQRLGHGRRSRRRS